LLDSGNFDNSDKIDYSIKDINHYIVGIGASAGGLEALGIFFENMPFDSGLSFVVVQHLSPDYKSLMAEILSKKTKMKVLQAEDGMIVLPNYVYLIPPKKNITIYHKKLILTDSEHEHGTMILNLPIDIFFKSLAKDQGKKSIGIILSGTGSDGTRGIRAIKEANGMVMVQDEKSAKFDGMPRSAISTGIVDYVLSAEKMPEELLKYIQNPYVLSKNHISLLQDNDCLTKIFALIRNKTGIDFSYYKETTVLRRIERRLSINQIGNLNDYVRYLLEYSNEIITLSKELLIGVTSFFRDTDAFEEISLKVIPSIFENKISNSPIRVWVAGCSTGEEAYSIAILFKEYMEKTNKKFDIKIFATDIDTNAVSIASTGIYPESIIADVGEDRLQKYFTKKGDNYKIMPCIREMIIFARHNIIKDPPFSKIDLISCRNLLIYLQNVLQKKVISLFHFALNKGSFLFLGTSETIGDWDNFFVSFVSKFKIYQHQDGIKTMEIDSINIYNPENTDAYSKERINFSKLKNSATDIFINSIYEQLIEQYVPLSIIVNENNELLHAYGDINQYLKIPSGKISLDILKMVKDDLSIALSTAIHRVLKDKKELIYKDVIFKEKDVVKSLTLNIKPCIDTKTDQTYILIIFQENKILDTNDNIERFDVENKASQRIMDLEHDLQYIKEDLQTVIEELETSKEELQSTNEELLVANEELQSINEELNGEIITISSQYQSKIKELTDLNDDINNLSKITDNVTIFLDKKLYIRKYIQVDGDEINLLKSDIGKPLSRISCNFKYIDLVEETEKVFESLILKEIEIQTIKGSWYLLRILPYTTKDNKVKGCVLTFVNITKLKESVENIKKFSYAVEQSLNSIIITDVNGNIQYVNPIFLEKTGYCLDEIIGKNVRILKFALMSPSVYEDILKTIKEGKIWRGKLCNRKKNGELYWISASISGIRDEIGEITNYVNVSQDIIDIKTKENKLLIEESILSKILKFSSKALLYIDYKGKILYTNKKLEKIFEIDKNKILNTNFNNPDWIFLDTNNKEIDLNDLPFSKIKTKKDEIKNMIYNIKLKSEKIISVSIDGIPIFDDLNNLAGAIFFLDNKYLS